MHATLPPHRTLVRNILRTYHQATRTDLRSGACWYPLAYLQLFYWAEKYGYSVETLAVATAMISPQCQWEVNLEIMRDLLEGKIRPRAGALRRNVRTARRILKDRATDIREYCKDGPKVEAFSANLSGDLDAITIDVHSGQAALADPTDATAWTRPRYAIIAEAYRDAARQTRRRPAILQAIVWVTWKRLHPPHRKGKNRR